MCLLITQLFLVIGWKDKFNPDFCATLYIFSSIWWFYWFFRFTFITWMAFLSYNVLLLKITKVSYLKNYIVSTLFFLGYIRFFRHKIRLTLSHCCFLFLPLVSIKWCISYPIYFIWQTNSRMDIWFISRIRSMNKHLILVINLNKFRIITEKQLRHIRLTL